MNEYGKEVKKKMDTYMSNEDSIDKEVSDIQNAMHGVEVRGALASGVKKSFDKSKSAESKSIEAYDITQNLLDESFDTSVINQNFENRLDDEIAKLQPEWTQFKDQTNAQLAQTGYKMNKMLTSGKLRKPMISIIDDDGRNDILSTWVPMLQSKTFKMDVAVITNMPGNHPYYLTWEQLDDLKENYSVDLLNHLHEDLNVDTLTESQLRYQFEASKRELFSRGHFSGDILVYPRGRSDYKSRQIARDYFRGAFLNIGGNNYPPLVQFNLRRTVLFGDTEFGDMAHIKQMIDNTVNNVGWTVLISHSQGAFDHDKVAEIIDYANQYVDDGELEWVHASEGLDRMGNIVDIGDNEYQSAYDPGAPYPYKIIDCEGVTHSSFEMMVGKLGTSVDYNTPIDDFPRDKYSQAYILTSNETISSFPGGAGILETFHALNPIYSYQQYRPYSNNELYARSWNGNGWGKFERVSNLEFFKDNEHNFNTPITDFPRNRTVFTNITNSNTTINSFPDGAGVLETVRTGAVSFSYQLYKPVANNHVYKRNWTNGDWGAFERIGEDDVINSEYDFNSPPSAFKSNVTTTTIVITENSDGFPEGAGILKTYRQGPYQYNYQTYKPVLSNSLYIRTSNGNGSAWNSFTKL